MTFAKLTGFHAKLFPRLVDSGFLVFDNERIKFLKSLIDTGTLTKPGTMEPTKRALGMLPLSLDFGKSLDTFYSFHICIKNNKVCAGWDNGEELLVGYLPLLEAIQKFELMYRNYL